MKKIVLVFSFLTAVLVSAFAQKNVMKLHLESFAYKAVNVGYERAVKDKISLGINVGVLMPREIPDFIYKPEYTENYVNIERLKNNLSGTMVVPEVRFYPGAKGAPKWFYLGAYAKINNYKCSVSETFNYQFTDQEYNDLDPTADYYPYVDHVNKSIDATTDLELKLSQFGMGAQLGVQFPLGERFSLDWGIAGLGFNVFKLTGELSIVDVPVDYSNYVEEAEANLNADIKDVPFVGDNLIKVTDEGSSIKASLPFSSAGFRTYFSIGYRF